MPTLELDDSAPPTPRPDPGPLSNVIGLVTVFALFPLGVAYLAVWLVATWLLHVALAVAWLPRGRRVLYVASDDPRFKPYLDAHVEPRLPKSTVRLNGSERAGWSSLDLGVWLYRLWAGDRSESGVVVVVRVLRGPLVLRFARALEAVERGEPGPLRALEAKLALI
jgi:hypothetical protein